MLQSFINHQKMLVLLRTLFNKPSFAPHFSLCQVGVAGKASPSLRTCQSGIYVQGLADGVPVRASIYCSRYRSYLHHLFPSRRRAWDETGKGLRNGYSRGYSASPACNSVAYHTRVVWKSLAQKSVQNAQTRLSIEKIAQAISLGFSYSYMVVPSIFALACGTHLAWAEAAPSTQFVYDPKNRLYMQAQDSRMYMTGLIFSIFEGLFMLIRAFYLGILFTPSIVMAPLADSFGPRFRKLWLQAVHQTLEKAGPAFIKWGQWAATRPDLFPEDLCTELSKLHMKAPEHSFAYTKKTIERAFGRRINEIFDDFEEEPVASGSIAQVHRASVRSRYPGRLNKPILVAVKVRHPGVGESIKRDFAIINVVAKISGLIPGLTWLRLDESVQQFAVFMMSQVDLAREAAHLSRFTYNFRRWKDVSFPRPVYPLVHPAVLVESFEHGESVTHYVDDHQGDERIKRSLAHIGTHALLKMLLVDNFVHADMHPGNILVRVAQSDSSRKKLFKAKPHVIFLDVGMTAELSKSDQINLLEFFKAVATRDGRTAAESTLRLSRKQRCPDPESFIQEVKESFDFWGTPEGDLVHPADCMHQLLEKVRRHRVNIDGNVCTVMVTLLVLEGWQRKLDPGYDVMHTLQTLLLKSDWAESLSYTIEGLMAP
ncbi:probable serine/threonine-protein kinase abkC isoform X1 [Salvia splendens]|uniref:probable serine/threonine-protein kinase abkC isoform X1 n=1 Tax=Salvia splendens TaxID=180675 RepID=UPI001C262A29|nr:probable serine/threonine-protein kinase abkC isoform X1 [Salvia splendens]